MVEDNNLRYVPDFILSRLTGLDRQQGMNRKWLTALILLHLAVSFAHGEAHIRAHVPLSQTAMLFVFIVILAGPLAGLALTWWDARIGNWIVAITMTSSFVFGLVNHFVVAGQDHVSHVAPQWQSLFATSAAMLAVIELLGAGLAIRLASETTNQRRAR
jgi:hypothetical protein